MPALRVRLSQSAAEGIVIFSLIVPSNYPVSTYYLAQAKGARCSSLTCCNATA